MKTMKKREEFLSALIENPTVTKAYKSIGISRNTAYKFLNDETFQADLLKLKTNAMNEAVTYLQGKLTRCSEVLMDIVNDPEASAQVRINAINSVFLNCRTMTESVDILMRIVELEKRTNNDTQGGEHDES